MEDISIHGPKIIFEIPIFGGIKIPETTVNMVLISLTVALVFFLLTRNMKKVPNKRQLVAEFYVDIINGMVRSSMGESNMHYAPYIGTIFIFSWACNYSTLIGLRAPTSDFNTTLGMAVMTTILVHKAKMKNGIVGYVKTYTEPVVFMTPMNIISEISTPVSMCIRHYGNMVAGYIITTLLYGALATLTTAVFNIGIPILQIGIPAFASVYFDLFTGFVQAFIFATLSMVFISMAEED